MDNQTAVSIQVFEVRQQTQCATLLQSCQFASQSLVASSLTQLSVLSLRLLWYQGERAQTKDNSRLGKFDLGGIGAAPKGVPKIEVTFDLDANGILTVLAEDTASGTRSNITITNDSGRLTKEQIEDMVRDAEKFKAEDEAHQARIKAKTALESYTFNLKNMLSTEDKVKDNIDAQDKIKIDAQLATTTKWLDANAEADREEYETKLKEIEKIVNPVISKLMKAGATAPAKEEK